MPDSIHDDIRTALNTATESLKTDGATPPSGNDDFAEPKSEVLPPVFPEGKEPAKTEEPTAPKAPKGPQRGPDGKFLPQQPQAPQALGSPPSPPENQEGSAPFDPARPPQGWRPEMKEKWNAIPQDIREEIMRREHDTAVGVQKLQQYYAPAAYCYQAIEPYAQYLVDIQEDPQQYMDGMFKTEQTLRLGNPAQKIELLLALADTYGVPLRTALDSAMNGGLRAMLDKAHAHHQTPPAIPPQIMQELQQMRQFRDEVENSAAEAELEDFAADPNHPLLEYVREDMADLLEYGYAETYQDAYDLACWRNPQIRPYYMQAASGQPVQQYQTPIQQRQQAAAAIVAPGSAPLMDGGESKNEDEDIHDTVRRAWNQAASGSRA